MPAAVDAHKNLAVSNVATAPSPATSGTSLVVTAGHGARFPTAPFNATIWPSGAIPDPSNAEIVRVTAIATNTLTITRAQEGSTARSVIVGDQIAATVTSKTLTDLETLLGTRAAQAQSGALRLDNAQWLTARNAADSADLLLLRANASNEAEVTPFLNLLGGGEAGTGDDIFGDTPLWFRSYAGTSAAPLTGVGPNVKIVRQENISAITMPQPAASVSNSALVVMSRGKITSTPQATGIYGYADGGGTTAGADAAGLAGTGIINNATSTGWGMGAYLEGRRDVTTGGCYGAEITANNNTAGAVTYDPNGPSKSMGIWLPSRGLSGIDNAVGIQMGALSGSQWIVGLGFTAGAIVTSSIRDDSSAATSILINGSHATAAIGIADGSGRVGIGTLTPTGLLHVASNITDPSQAGIVLAPAVTLSTGFKAIISAQTDVRPTASINTVYGLLFIPNIVGTEGVTTNPITGTTNGVFCRIDTQASYDSAITAAINFSAAGVSHAGGGTITDLYGFRSDINSGTARVTNSWQVFAAGNAPSYFGGDVQHAEGTDLVLGTTTGTRIGTATTQKIGFYAATPVVQRAGAAQAAAPAGGTGTAAGGWSTSANRDAAINLINEMRLVLVGLGLMKGSA